MKIVYMGTPDFAVPPLAALVKNGYEVTAVVTQPDSFRNLDALISMPLFFQSTEAPRLSSRRLLTGKRNQA